MGEKQISVNGISNGERNGISKIINRSSKKISPPRDSQRTYTAAQQKQMLINQKNRCALCKIYINPFHTVYFRGHRFCLFFAHRYYQIHILWEIIDLD